MLAITWSCDKFDQYLYGRDIATIETDHEPWKSVFKKEIHKSPKRPQRMPLALQKYNLEVQYNKGTLMHIADALSRAYLKTADGAQTEFCEVRALETVDHEEHIQIEPPKRFPWTNCCRWWYSGTSPCYQARVARQEKMPSCCPTVLWWAKRVGRVAGSSFPWRTACSTPFTSKGHANSASQKSHWHWRMCSLCSWNFVLAKNEK